MSQNRSKSLGTLGLAMKSGNVVSGEFLTEQAIRAGTARLVIVAEDASDNTKRNFVIPVHIIRSLWQSNLTRILLEMRLVKSFALHSQFLIRDLRQQLVKI